VSQSLRRAALSLIAAGTLAPTCARAQAHDAKDWPTYNHDVLGTRHNRGETALGTGNVGRLEEKWRFPSKASGQEIEVIHATPAVVNGYDYFGTVNHDPRFHKLTPDGKVRRSYRNPAYTSAPPHAEVKKDGGSTQTVRLQPSDEGGSFGSALVTGDTVFIDFTAVASGKLVVLNAATGALLKEITLGPVWSGPSVSRGRVYVGTGNTPFTRRTTRRFSRSATQGPSFPSGSRMRTRSAGSGAEQSRVRPVAGPRTTSAHP
jgi:polyvinyl alcohol dehydrogenase (cytochrome)